MFIFTRFLNGGWGSQHVASRQLIGIVAGIAAPVAACWAVLASCFPFKRFVQRWHMGNGDCNRSNP
jgi:hypothetical protein